MSAAENIGPHKGEGPGNDRPDAVRFAAHRSEPELLGMLRELEPANWPDYPAPVPIPKLLADIRIALRRQRRKGAK